MGGKFWANNDPYFSQVIDHTVDGLEIRPANLMRLVVYPHDLQVFFNTSQVVIAGILNHQQYVKNVETRGGSNLGSLLQLTKR